MKRTIIPILLLFFPLFLFAQPGDEETLPSDEQEIIKAFDAQLTEADKVDVAPLLPSIDTKPEVISYLGIEPVLLTLEYDAPKIQPLPLQEEDGADGEHPLHNGYVKAAFGYPLSPYLEADYHHYKDRLLAGGDLLYQAAYNDGQLEHQRFSNIGAGVDGTFFFDKGFAVGADMGYRLDNHYFYGYDHDLFTFERADVAQSFSTLDAGLRFHNTLPNVGDINYAADFDFYNLRDNFNGKENGISLTLGMGKYFKGKHLAEIKIKEQFTALSGDSSTQRNNLLAFIPSFTYQHGKFKFKAGVNLSVMEPGFRVFPDAELVADVYKSKVVAFLGWTGGGGQFSLRSRSGENPYIAADRHLDQSETQYPYGGAKFDFGKYAARVEVGYKMVKNQEFYVNDWAVDGKRFAIVHDNANYFVTRIGASAEFLEGLVLDGNMLLQNISPDSLTAAYHEEAGFGMDVGLAYNNLLDKKLSVGARIYTNSKIAYLAADGTDANLPARLDINLFTEYRLNPKFKLFLELNNINNQKYQRWNGYQNFGFNARVGAFYKF